MTDAHDDQFAAQRELLARKLRASGLSARKAADRMNITDTRLRHIINGYQPVGRGQRIEVVAPTDTYADIALALGATADEVEAAGRPDAARVMRKILGSLPMETYGLDTLEWRRILAHHDEIREWASEGIEVYMPPDIILEMFTDDQLLGEVGRRIRNGSPFKSFEGSDEEVTERQDRGQPLLEDDQQRAGDTRDSEQSR